MSSILCARALGPHLDYHQSDELREEFYKVHDTPGKYMEQMNKTEPHGLMGDHDTEDGKLGVMLGIWKPLYPSEVRHEILRTFCFLNQTSTY